MLTTLTCKLGFEVVTCSRCGGSGNYSYNQIHGTRCYGCGGTGYKRTKRGAVAYRMYEDSLKVRLDTIQPGDLMQVEDLARRYFARVVEVRQEDDGGMVVTTTHDRYGRSGLHAGPGHMVRKGWSGEEKRPLLDAALAYQSTLNAKGK